MDKKSKKYLIETGIGLQDVDHLKNSEYLLSKSKSYINGDISLNELDDLISSYYEQKDVVKEDDKQADIIAVRIAKLISEESFSYSLTHFQNIHKYLFQGILPNAGNFRTYNIRKEEWVLDGASVTYGDHRSIEEELERIFFNERRYDYKSKSINELIAHIAIIISTIWQVHPFAEGNTRTIAVFLIQYLNSLGFDVTNDTFSKNAWYFRNALVRANYTNIYKGIYEDRSYLNKFLRNLILGEDNGLKNKNLHISYVSQKLRLHDNDERETQLYFLIKDNPKITTEELASELGVSLRTVKSMIARFVDMGVLKRVNGKRYGYWEFIDHKKSPKPY